MVKAMLKRSKVLRPGDCPASELRREAGARNRRCPATVSGEQAVNHVSLAALALPGRPDRPALTREPGDLPPTP